MVYEGTVERCGRGQHATNHDAYIWRTLCCLLNVDPATARHSAALAFLPARLGGLGLFSASRVADAAYYAGWADSLPVIAQRDPALAARCVDELILGEASSGATFRAGAAAAQRLGWAAWLARPGPPFSNPPLHLPICPTPWLAACCFARTSHILPRAHPASFFGRPRASSPPLAGRAACRRLAYSHTQRPRAHPPPAANKCTRRSAAVSGCPCPWHATGAEPAALPLAVALPSTPSGTMRWHAHAAVRSAAAPALLNGLGSGLLVRPLAQRDASSHSRPRCHTGHCPLRRSTSSRHGCPWRNPSWRSIVL